MLAKKNAPGWQAVRRLECKERQLLAFDRSCGSSRKPVQSYLTAIILDATARGFHTFGPFSFEKSPKSNRIQAVRLARTGETCGLRPRRSGQDTKAGGFGRTIEPDGREG